VIGGYDSYVPNLLSVANFINKPEYFSSQ